jgi:hypothetical protein
MHPLETAHDSSPSAWRPYGHRLELPHLARPASERSRRGATPLRAASRIWPAISKSLEWKIASARPADQSREAVALRSCRRRRGSLR